MSDVTKDARAKPDKPMSTDWHFHPRLPVGYAPYWLWPPRPLRLAKWVLHSWLLLTDRVYYIALALVVALWLQPFGPHEATLAPGWVLHVALRNLVLLVITAGVLHLWFYGIDAQGNRLKYDPRPMSSRKNALFKFGYQTWDNMFYSLAYGVPIATGYEVLIRWLFANGMTQSFGFADTPVGFILLFPGLTIFHGLHFYLIHRTLHWPPLYRRVHAIHHRNVNPGPWSGNSMHPVEQLFYLSAMLVFVVVPAHPVHVLFLLYWLQLGAAMSHSGYEAVLVTDKTRLLVGSFFHQLHHRYYECNYGTGELPWDKWFGTFHDGSPEATARTRKRKRDMHAR